MHEQLLRELPVGLQRRHQLGHLVAGGDSLERDDVDLGADRTVEVRQADASVPGLTGEHQPLQLTRVGGVEVLRIPDDQLVAIGIAGKIAQERTRAQVVLLGPHPLQPGLEVVTQQLGPLVALDAAPAPMQLEQDVRVQVGVDLVERHLQFTGAPVGRLRDRSVG